MNLRKDDCSEWAAGISNPPRGIREIFRYMGPAWVFTASQIGGGEALSVTIIADFLRLRKSLAHSGCSFHKDLWSILSS